MPNRYRLIVPQSVYDSAIRHARQAFPDECCGFLAGRVELAEAYACEYLPLGNAASDPRTRFQADLRSLVEAHRQMRRQAWVEVAVVHSHPNSPPVPSRTDLAENAYGTAIVHLIISLATAVPEVQAWRLFPDSFEEVDWTLIASPVDESRSRGQPDSGNDPFPECPR